MSLTMDWSVGEYEPTAERLLPASEVVVATAVVEPDEHVVDVGCGTGNTALLAAARGARVTGVDPAKRLLGVARERAAASGLDVTFVEGTADAIPLPDGAADAVLSTFGVMFAPDAPAAVRELDRVTAPGGRIVLSDFPPEGPQLDAIKAAGEEYVRLMGPPPVQPQPPGPPPLAWHDAGALRAAFGPLGFDVTVDEHTMPFAAASPEAYVDNVSRHPTAVMALAGIEDPSQRAQVAEAIRRRMIEVFAGANEEPAAFRITVKYVVAAIRRR